MYSKIILLKTSGLSQGFNDLQEAENAAVAGDCIVVYPGTYDLGAGQLVLKNGVNKKFMPGVTITSSHAQATIWDNDDAVIQAWEGRPVITNTGDGEKYLFENANTSISISPETMSGDLLPSFNAIEHPVNTVFLLIPKNVANQAARLVAGVVDLGGFVFQVDTGKTYKLIANDGDQAGDWGLIADVRQVSRYVSDGSKWLVNGNGVKYYRANIWQEETSAPNAFVLENTFGGPIVWSRSNIGVYFGTLAGAFQSNTQKVSQYRVLYYDSDLDATILWKLYGLDVNSFTMLSKANNDSGAAIDNFGIVNYIEIFSIEG